MVGQKHDVTPETWDSMIPQILQNVSEAGRKTLHDATRPTQPTNQFFSLGVDEMESWTLQFLSSLANSPGWEYTISIVNEHHQTLAHLAVLSRYTALLKKVAQWGINVDMQDLNGFTALHCAYLCGDLDSVQVLKGYGADEEIEDTLGRRPSDMYTQSTDDLGKSSSSSDHTSSLAQLSSAWEEQWVKLSVTPSQPGSCSEVETTTDPLGGRHETPHACEPSTSTRVMVASVSVPSPMSDNSFATEEGEGIDGAGELKLLIPVEHTPSPTAIQSPPVTTPEYARSYEQEQEEPETFHESKRHRHQVTRSTSSQQTMSKSPIDSRNAGGSPGEYGGLMQKRFNGPRFSHHIDVSAGLSTTNRLQFYSDPQARWPPSPTISSPETHESGIDRFLVRKDLTGQDQGGPLSSSLLARPSHTNIPKAIAIGFEGEGGLAYAQRLLGEARPARTGESEWRRLLPFFRVLKYILSQQFPPTHPLLYQPSGHSVAEGSADGLNGTYQGSSRNPWSIS